MEKILKMRKEFDALDNQIMSLLERRFKLSKEIGQHKIRLDLDIEDKARESEITEKVDVMIDEKFYIPYIQRTYICILEESKKVQKKVCQK